VAIIEPKTDVTPLIAHIHGILIFEAELEIMLIPVGNGIPIKKPKGKIRATVIGLLVIASRGSKTASSGFSTK
jgi:hypothetical protein